MTTDNWICIHGAKFKVTGFYDGEFNMDTLIVESEDGKIQVTALKPEGANCWQAEHNGVTKEHDNATVALAQVLKQTS